MVVRQSSERRLVGIATEAISSHGLKGLEIAPEAFCYGAYRAYQVPVAHVEDITGLSFGPLADPLTRQEAAIPVREVQRPDQLLL